MKSPQPESSRIFSAFKRKAIGALTLAVPFMLVAGAVHAQQQQIPIPNFNIQVGTANNPQEVSSALQILALLTVLTLAPALIMLTTSFTRIVIVFSFLRTALGTQQAPPNQVLVGLAMFLTFFIMAPVWNDINTNALQPYLQRRIPQDQAFNLASNSLKKFMSKFTREKDLALFVKISGIQRPNNLNDLPVWVMIPAFVISELKTAFQIGFVIYIPFLVIDMVVSSVLMSMGMMMLPPVMISLPIKLMLFVVVDGWHLLVASLIQSFTG